MSRQINLLDHGVTRVINSSGQIYTNSTTKNYTFTSGSDIRYVTLSNILSSNEFSNMSFAYKNFRIKSVMITINPCFYNNAATYGVLPMLYVDLWPSSNSGNPTNNNVIEADSAMLFTPLANTVKSASWILPGSGSQLNLWQDVANYNTLGQLVIGANPNVATVPSVGTIFDIRLSLICQFANPI